MNLIECTYGEDEKRAYLSHKAFSYDVTTRKERIAKGTSGKEVTFGLRPQDIRVTDKPTSKDAIEATVYITEQLGSRTIVTLQLGDDRVKAVAPPGFEPGIGDKKYMTFDEEKVRIFDRKTEKAIR